MALQKIHTKFDGIEGLLWAVVVSVVVVTIAAAVGKATINVTGSVLESQLLTADVVDTLLPDYTVNEIEVLREDEEGTHLQVYAQDNVVWAIAERDVDGWKLTGWNVMHR